MSFRGSLRQLASKFNLTHTPEQQRLLDIAVAHVEDVHRDTSYGDWRHQIGESVVRAFPGRPDLEIEVQSCWDDQAGDAIRVFVSVLHTTSLDLRPPTFGWFIHPPETAAGPLVDTGHLV